MAEGSASGGGAGSAGHAGDVVEMMNEIVDEVPREGLDREPCPVAAEAGPLPLVPGHLAEPRRDDASGVAQLSSYPGRISLRIAVCNGRGVLVPVGVARPAGRQHQHRRWGAHLFSRSHPVTPPAEGRVPDRLAYLEQPARRSRPRRIVRPESNDYQAYLAFLRDHGHNFIRLWRWEHFRSQSFGKAFHLCMTPQPWPRTGPGVAADGKPRFDLSRFDEAYFGRLRDRVIAAGNVGCYVSVMLFEGWGLHLSPAPDNVEGHPFHAGNNINRIGLSEILGAAAVAGHQQPGPHECPVARRDERGELVVPRHRVLPSR